MAASDDRGLLSNFVEHVWHWLRACYLRDQRPPDESWPIIEISPDLHNYAVSAWHEFEKNYPLDRLLEPIWNASDDVLMSHGLYGAQLRYKLHLVHRAAERARSGHRGLKRRFIEIVDNIIDSLGPTGLAGGLKELKDALVGSLPENE